jgi:prepilin-type N-terminal cleavage/methylation domain-containing protein
MNPRRRSGFTIIELLMTMTIVGLLSAVVVPKFTEMKRRAVATQILGDFGVMRHAAMTFYVDSGYFPRESPGGELPGNLSTYLPAGFSMQKEEWTMDYENWTLLTGTKFTNTGVAIGVSFVIPDEKLGHTAMRLVGNAPAFTVGSKYTFLISGY